MQEYITSAKAKEDQALEVLVDALGVDGDQLKALMLRNVTATNLNDYGGFDKPKASVDNAKARSIIDTTKSEYRTEYPSMRIYPTR